MTRLANRITKDARGGRAHPGEWERMCEPSPYYVRAREGFQRAEVILARLQWLRCPCGARLARDCGSRNGGASGSSACVCEVQR